MKAVVAAFNQEKALVGAFSVIVQLHRLIVYSTISNTSFTAPGPGDTEPAVQPAVSNCDIHAHQLSQYFERLNIIFVKKVLDIMK